MQRHVDNKLFNSKMCTDSMYLDSGRGCVADKRCVLQAMFFMEYSRLCIASSRFLPCDVMMM